MNNYGGGGSIPDWKGHLLGLREVLEDVLLSIDENSRAGVREDIACLEAFDSLNRYLDVVKSELGIL